MRIQDSVIVITGASSGIGRAAALEIAGRGGTVVLLARDQHALEVVAAECRTLGGQALVCPLDVTDAEAVRRAAEEAVTRYGRIDGWVNNAAVTMFGRFDELPLEAIRRVIETNLFGYIHGARAVLPHFLRQKNGVLVQVSSIVGKTGQALTSPYVVSKCAIVGLSDSLRQDLIDEEGIEVCTVYPRSTDTPLFQHGANYYGRKPKPVDPIDDPTVVARAIVKLLERPQREVVIGGNAKLASAAHTFAPAAVERKMAHLVRDEHFQDAPAAPSEGNLFASADEPARMRGGWKDPKADRRRRIARRVGLAGALAGVAIGVALGVSRKRRDGGATLSDDWRRDHGFDDDMPTHV